ncbi:GNAT family N-acetyltransferase [Paractinoplanes bogorensis]|nr:GNAT family N-acetyltransferase [Actinoplanes bogorensis]
MIEARPALDPELAALVAAQQHEGGQDFVPDDRAAYFVAVVDGRAVACAAWQPVPEAGVAELNRLYVRPAFRGRGIARQLIVAIEEEALAEGRPVVRLTAGAESPAAIALFQSSGYDRSGAWFTKRLAALVQ